MNFRPESFETNPQHDSIDERLELVLPSVAEDTIVQTILEGSGGAGNLEMTDPGLRFVRHLLSNSRPARHGFLPNFKDRDTVREMARHFIRQCGSAAGALQTLIRVAHLEQA